MTISSLLVIQGADQGARFEVGEKPIEIGRGALNPIRLHDTEVSRKHASVENRDDAFILTDLHSSNGTFVNGQPIRVHTLSSGDQVQVGRSVLLFEETISDDESRYVAEKIDLVSKHDSDDRSAIVGEISHEVAQELLDASGSGSFAGTSGKNLQVLYQISEEAVSPSISTEQLLKRILDLTITALGADRGCMLVADPQNSELIPQVFSHRRGFDASGKMPVSRSIVDYVLKNGQGVRTSDAQSDQRFATGHSILQAGIREAMCVPMHGRYELMGVVYVDITTPPERVVLESGEVNKLSEEQLRLLAAIGRQAALAIENNRYQQALVKAERLAAVGQTITTLSHHIKNILQGIRGGSYLIDMGLNKHDEDVVRKGWNIVEKNQNKIYHLVMDMLTFSKERKPSLEQASINETVAEVYELMQARAEEYEVQLECQLDETVPQTVFDPEGIHRAILNIVTNAIDAVEDEEQGTVKIETSYCSESDVVSVIVTDNGPGIEEDQLTTIFNIFESTKGARGTGIGLAVSQKIIREHGGEISVDSKPGSGCQFCLSWPGMEDEHPPEVSQTES